MRTAFALVMLVSLALSACVPSENAIQTAIAQTQLAAPTITPIPATATSTPTITPTITPSVTPSPTPDVRVVKIDAHELLLSLADLPQEGRYSLPGPGWIGVIHNQAILNDWGADEGGKYINETGRVDGWWIDFSRNSSKSPVPKEVYDNVVIYQSAAGAKLSITKYAGRAFANYVEVADAPQVGDASRLFLLKQGNNADYELEFSSRNCLHHIGISGLESEATPDFALKIAKILLEKITAAPLSNP